jgi:lysophospholipase L1-like esterase
MRRTDVAGTGPRVPEEYAASPARGSLGLRLPRLSAFLPVLLFVAAAQANTAIEPVPRDASWLKRHEEHLEIAQRGGVEVLFLGDSITDLWRKTGRFLWEEHFAPLHAANFGIDGDRTQHVLWRIQNGELAGLAPKAVVLLIGSNNIGLEKDGSPRNSTAEAIAGVTAVVQAIRTKLPDSELLLLAIFPRGEKGSPQRAQVAEVNRALAGLDDGQRVHFLDIGPRFLSPEGTLSREIMPDLLHLSEAGYAIWAEAIKEPLNKLLADQIPR